MALVAYDNSDSSEYEDEECTVISNKNENELSESELLNKQNNGLNPDSNQSIFNLLPQPSKVKKEILEEDDEYLHKKESSNDVKPKSRITIPSLKDFKDVEHTIPSSKTRAPIGKKSGLLSILPEPRNTVINTTKSLIPNVIKQNIATTTAKRKDPMPASTSIAKVGAKGSLITEYSDESDDEVQNDFFSINKPVELPVEDLPLEGESNPAVETKKEPRSIESYLKKDADDILAAQNHLETSSSEDYYSMNIEKQVNGVSENANSEMVLDDEAILKLCGTRGKRKREEIQIVEVNQQEVLSEAREWLLKGLMDDTSKRQSASKKHGNEPTSQQKRKHQITYLAHQAKANEAELQNQWANNRMTKRQTQSKYGF